MRILVAVIAFTFFYGCASNAERKSGYIADNYQRLSDICHINGHPRGSQDHETCISVVADGELRAYQQRAANNIGQAFHRAGDKIRNSSQNSYYAPVYCYPVGKGVSCN